MTKKKTGKGSAKPTGKTTIAKSKSGKATSKPQSGGPVFLSGGNPQIAKGYGDEPVQKYIAAMPDWKSGIGRRLDELIVKGVPKVEKAVKWNSPFYGNEKDLWFLSFHCFTKYVKITFLRGAALHPLPPGESKHKDVRYLDIHEGDEVDEVQFMDWVKQASKLPGERSIGTCVTIARLSEERTINPLVSVSPQPTFFEEEGP